jgi:hypothetical protein
MIFRLSMIHRAGLAGLRAIWWKLRGLRTLTTEVEEIQRWEECEVCPHRIEGVSQDEDQCALCGCLLRSKVLLCSEQCPIGKWKRVVSRKVKQHTI